MSAKNMQHTICKEISYSGIGLHSGKDVLMTFKPAAVNTGVIYVRTDLPGRPEIKALAENVSSTVKATTISANGAEVFTVEHLMAALSMMGVDNIYIEMSSPEPPVTDGSAKVFCATKRPARFICSQGLPYAWNADITCGFTSAMAIITISVKQNRLRKMHVTVLLFQRQSLREL